jgi:hypothetical protein
MMRDDCFYAGRKRRSFFFYMKGLKKMCEEIIPAEEP